MPNGNRAFVVLLSARIGKEVQMDNLSLIQPLDGEPICKESPGHLLLGGVPGPPAIGYPDNDGLTGRAQLLDHSRGVRALGPAKRPPKGRDANAATERGGE